MKKGILVLLSGLLFIGCFTDVAKSSELTDDYFDIATNYFNSNDYKKTIEYLDLILSIEPDNLKAKTLLKKIIPDDEKTKTVVVEEILDKAENPETVKIVDVESVNLQKEMYDSAYYNKKGQEFYQQGDLESAIQYFYKSIALNKKNATAYNNLGMSYWQKNNIEEAIKNFKKAFSINSKYTQPLTNLANVYMQQGDEKNEFLYLQKAVSINPNDEVASLFLGDYYRRKNEYFSAIKSYKNVIEINNKNSRAYMSLALCYFEIEEFNLCSQNLMKFLDLNPESDYAYYILAKAALATSHFEYAKSFITKAIELNDCANYNFVLARIEYANGNYEVAKGIFQRLLNDNSNAELFNYMGLCCYKLKDADAATVNFRKAIELDGLKSIYYYNLAQCYKSIGDKRTYTRYVNTATQINPVNIQDYIDLSYIYMDNSNPSYAIKTLEQAISKYPEAKSLYFAKLRIFETIGDNIHYNELKDLIEAKFNDNEEIKRKK